MNTPTKLAGFAVGLGAIFGVAAGLGAAVGPFHVVDDGGAPGDSHTMTESAPRPGGVTAHADHGAMATEAAMTAEPPGGLMVSRHGYTLDLVRSELPSGSRSELRFRVLGTDGAPVTGYTETHGKDLHLIVVRRDLGDFQHVHPRMSPEGTWQVPLDLTEPGEYLTATARRGTEPRGHDDSTGLDHDH